MIHFFAAIWLQFLGPAVMAWESGALPLWFMAQGLLTATMLFANRILVAPPWCHASKAGFRRRSYSILGVMGVTLAVAIIIGISPVVDADFDFYYEVLKVFGIPMLGWFAAVVMIRARTSGVLIVTIGATLCVVTCLVATNLQWFGVFEDGICSVVAGALTVLILSNLLHLAYRRPAAAHKVEPARAMPGSNVLAFVGDEIPESAWALRAMRGGDSTTIGRRSYIDGLTGLAVLFAVTATIGPVVLKVVELIGNNSPGFLAMSMLWQASVYPIAIAYTFLFVGALFREGWRWKGLIAACLLSLPGWFAIFATLTLIHEPMQVSELRSFCQAMYGISVGVSLTAIMFTIWSRWNVVTFKQIDDESKPASIASLMELTAIVALMCAAGASLGGGEFDAVIAILMFAVFGSVAAVAVIGAMIGRLSDSKSRAGSFTSIAIAMVTAIAACSMMAVFGSGWTMTPLNLLWITIISVGGAMLILGMQSVCLRWLRACGWRCVR